jgi:hypothetical protein
MDERFRTVHKATDLTTLDGLKRETYTAVVRYFAPAVAIVRELGITAGIPIISQWMTYSLREDHDQDKRPPAP